MKRDQLALFELTVMSISLEDRITLAMATIAKLFEDEVPICLAYSSGKDSSVCADLVLRAAQRLVKTSNIKPLVIITSSDTLMENPEMTAHCRRDLKKMKAYGDKNGFRVITRIAKPALLSTWQLKVLSGRGLPSFAGMNTDCASITKYCLRQSCARKYSKNLAKPA